MDTQLDTNNSVIKIRLFLIFLLFVILGFIILERSGWLDLINNQVQLQTYIEQFGFWGPIAIILLIACAIVVSPIPSAPVALVSGALYGHTFGTIYVILGSVSGALLAFTISRFLGYEYVNKKLAKHVPVKLTGSPNTLMAIVFFTRLAPFISFDIISYAAGLTRLDYGRFILATIAGITPISFVLAHIGSEATTGEIEGIALALLLLGLLTGIPLIIRKIMKRKVIM
jgi:uncharacterized membrane protein YdjX (TVP38/TMEM64 family)